MPKVGWLVTWGFVICKPLPLIFAPLSSRLASEVGGVMDDFPEFKGEGNKAQRSSLFFPGKGLGKWALQPYSPNDYVDKIKHRFKRKKKKSGNLE